MKANLKTELKALEAAHPELVAVVGDLVERVEALETHLVARVEALEKADKPTAKSE